MTMHENLRQISADISIQDLKSKLSNVENISEKEKLKNEFELFLSNIPVESKKHIIILLHGIRTLAPWQQSIEDELRDFPNVEVMNFSYGYYGLFKFLRPSKYKHEPISIIKDKINIVISRNKGAQISILAHSFGTFITSEILKENIQVDNLILCGSIITDAYKWETLSSNLLVINEAGSKDIWPVFASHVSREYGPTGTFGFKGPIVKDRFHLSKHSDYFNKDFIKKYWIPFLIHGHIVPSNWGKMDNKFSLIIEKAYVWPTLVVLFLVILSLFALIFCVFWFYEILIVYSQPVVNKLQSFL